MNNSVYIIGGGESLIGYDFNKLKAKETIGVNRAIEHVPNLNYFITMDFTALKKITPIKDSKATKIFIANFSKPYIKEEQGKIVDSRFGLVYTLEDFDMIIKSRQESGLGVQFNDFRNGNNSGFCALQLAIMFGYKQICLLGIDLIAQKQTHFHKGYGETVENFNKKLTLYYENFKVASKLIPRDVRVYNCSKISRLNDFFEYKEV